RFRFVPAPGTGPQHVNVAGDFNNWSNTTDELKRVDGAFETTLRLPEGVHYYKFVVDSKWTNDPASEKELEIDDNYGGKNSAVMIGPDGRHLPPVQANAINVGAVTFDPTDVRDCNVASRNLLRLSLRTQADGVSRANVLVWFDNNEWRPTPMW